MSLEDFQLIDTGTSDNSIKKRDLLKIFHQKAPSLINSDQSIEFIFREIKNYHQIGDAYLQYETTI